MKKFWIAVLSIFLSIVLIYVGFYVYDCWQHVKDMSYCSFAINGTADWDEEVVFYLEDGRIYKTIPFPEYLGHYDIVDALSSVESETIVKENGGKSIMYSDPFEMGDKYVVIAPRPKLPPFFPKSSIAIPFAYYAVEVES